MENRMSEIKEVIQNLERNHMRGYYVKSIDELHNLIQSFLKSGERIGCGDSVTLEDTGIFKMLRQGDYIFLDKHQGGLTSEQKREIYLENFGCDTFVTGTNAVTLDGKLFNIDGNGSRVAPMLYGPKQVVVVVGTNKLVPDVKEAILRTRQIAAPRDAVRLKKSTPCTELGKCVDCHHETRICNDFVLITGQFDKERIKVVIVEGNYGY